MLRHGRIFDSPCIEEVDMGKKNRKDLTEELTYRHHEQQEEASELQQGEPSGETWMRNDSRSGTIRSTDP